MIRNYLKIAWRNLIKNKISSFINIGGLAVGMVVAMLIGLWIWDELSFNKYHQNYDRIAIVMQSKTYNGTVNTDATIPLPLDAELRKSYGSDFKAVVMVAGNGSHVVALDNNRQSKNGCYMEPQGPEMFGLHMLQGTRKALADPSSILISASMAKAFFGNADPMDKTLRIDNQVNGKVAGVYADFPQNSSFADMGFIAPWEMFYTANDIKSMKEPWRPNFVSLYVQMNDNADVAALSLKIRDAKLRNVNAVLAKKKPALSFICT